MLMCTHFVFTTSQFLTPYMTENIILDKHTVNAVK